jgi:hypothetical protein
VLRLAGLQGPRYRHQHVSQQCRRHPVVRRRSARRIASCLDRDCRCTAKASAPKLSLTSGSRSRRCSRKVPGCLSLAMCPVVGLWLRVRGLWCASSRFGRWWYGRWRLVLPDVWVGWGRWRWLWVWVCRWWRCRWRSLIRRVRAGRSVRIRMRALRRQGRRGRWGVLGRGGPIGARGWWSRIRLPNNRSRRWSA